MSETWKPVVGYEGRYEVSDRGRARSVDRVIVQDYLVGLGGGDVTPKVINEIIDDLAGRDKAGEPVWKVVAA